MRQPALGITTQGTVVDEAEEDEGDQATFMEKAGDQEGAARALSELIP